MSIAGWAPLACLFLLRRRRKETKEKAKNLQLLTNEKKKKEEGRVSWGREKNPERQED